MSEYFVFFLYALSIVLLIIGVLWIFVPALHGLPPVPTKLNRIRKALKLVNLQPEEVLYDLGSGDGRTVITAAKRGAKALGIEYNPEMVELSKRNAAKAGVSDRANFVKADLFESDFSEATIITMFLLPGINIRLRPKTKPLALRGPEFGRDERRRKR